MHLFASHGTGRRGCILLPAYTCRLKSQGNRCPCVIIYFDGSSEIASPQSSYCALSLQAITQEFRRADEDMLKKRRIIRTRRGPAAVQATVAGGAAAPGGGAGATNPFAGISLAAPAGGSSNPFAGVSLITPSAGVPATGEAASQVIIPYPIARQPLIKGGVI